MATKNKQQKKSGELWSKEDEQIVLDMLGDSTMISIARKVGRTVRAVNRHLERMGYYDIALETGGFRTYEFASIIGVDPTTIIRWIKEEGLPAKQLYKQGKKDKRNRYYYIYPESFWRWAKKNKHLLNFAKIKRGSLLPEPNWLDKMVALDKQTKGTKSQDTWTPAEEALIWKMYYQEGMTQKEIGNQTGRSRRGIQARLNIIRKRLG